MSNDRLCMAVEAGKCVGWDWDVKTGHDRWFGDLQTMFRNPIAQLIPDASRTFTAGYTRKIEHSSRTRLPMPGKAGNPTQQSSGCVRLDGNVRWITARGQFYYDANGEAERMLGMAVDITERKLAEDALKKSEEKFSKAFRRSPMALAVTSAKDHRYLDVNETFEQITGWRRDEVIGRTPFDLNLWVNPAQRTEMVNEIQTKGTVRNLEFRFRCKDGEQRDGLGSAELIEIEGEPCVFAVIADITERRQIQEQLQVQRGQAGRYRWVGNGRNHRHRLGTKHCAFQYCRRENVRLCYR